MDHYCSYITEYSRINIGTNPTKAVMMLARIKDYDYVNGSVARLALDYIQKHSISLDCDKVSGSDHELCLSVLQTSFPGKCFLKTPVTETVLPKI